MFMMYVYIWKHQKRPKFFTGYIIRIPKPIGNHPVFFGCFISNITSLIPWIWNDDNIMWTEFTKQYAYSKNWLQNNNF